MRGEIFMYEKYFIKEPLGNNLGDSKLERCWNGFMGKYGMRMSRIHQFDPYAVMSRQPDKYVLEKFTIADKQPTTEWITKALKNFIHDEFSTTESVEMPEKFTPQIEGVIDISDDYLQSFFYKSEWENLVNLELPKDDTVSEMAQCIYSIICNPQIGSTKNVNNVDKDRFINQITPLLENHSRLLFVLPGCPFKDQNRFRVPFDASSVDFGELSFLTKLHNMIQALYQVHPYGGQAIILTDGRLYREIFKVESEEVEEYQWRLKYYRNRLNIQGDVSIIDLKEMIDRANDNGEIDNILMHIKEVVKKEHMHDTYFNTLIQGMKWNINSKKILEDLTDKEAWMIIKGKREDVEGGLIKVWDDYNKIAVEAAIEYASINLMLKWTDLVRKFFPDAVRCTVHPKKDQIALAMNYAWNGVAWSKKWPISFKDISTIPYSNLANYKKVKKVQFHSNGYPCFFTTEQRNQVLDNAKNVLAADGWNVDDLFGRELTIYDHSDFINLGKNDPNFVWEKKIMSEEYYTALLEFRINHYRKYGFGVHAIFKDGKLIGQMGLQVLNEQKQQIEFVIFLGKDYVGQGIGTRLLSYLVERCRDENIMKIYGIIRSGNKKSKKLIEKFGGKELKSISHYHQTGILYEVNIKR
jgi:pyoverdine/dityrosine biosynthesis protein Dit1/RimJ/RimL family protein N-acetyltransferase